MRVRVTFGGRSLSRLLRGPLFGRFFASLIQSSLTDITPARASSSVPANPRAGLSPHREPYNPLYDRIPAPPPVQV